MKMTQDQTNEYKTALQSAESFNAELQRLLSTANSFSATELRALQRYLPDSVDEIAVMRDLETIVSSSNMALTRLTSNSSNEISPSRVNDVQNSSDDALVEKIYEVAPHSFSLGVIGTYSQFKRLLQDFERNAYPLEVSSITFTPDEGAIYNFSMTLETYSLNESVAK